MTTFNATALRGYTQHTPTGFLIFNEGKETRFIPEDMRSKLVGEGVIEGDPLDHDDSGKKGGSKRGAASTRAKGAARRKPSGPVEFNAGRFTVAKADGIGMYEISGPGLASPESVKGKAKVQARLDALNAAPAGSSDAPAD